MLYGIFKHIFAYALFHLYNRYKGGVDVSDQIIALYEYDRRVYKWWKRILYHLLDVVIINSYIIYRTYNKGIGQKDYRLQLAKQLIEMGHEYRNNTKFSIGKQIKSNTHFPKKCSIQAECAMHHKKRTRTNPIIMLKFAILLIFPYILCIYMLNTFE